MNHSFKQSLTDNTCAECGYDKISHTSLAQCESCPTIGPCEVIDEILMCATCQARDKEIKMELGEVAPDGSKEARVSELTNRLAREIPVDRRSYFVGRLTAIVDIEKELEGTENSQYKLAELVEANLILLRERLIAKHTEIRELQAQSVADQKYLNQIVPQLRAEEREKFKAYDINYKPTTAMPAAPSKPRQSASDKSIESFAKMMNISVEQARIIMANSIKSTTGAVCTCAVTPGICKVHPK